jgi:hypothetical protein
MVIDSTAELYYGRYVQGEEAIVGTFAAFVDYAEPPVSDNRERAVLNEAASDSVFAPLNSEAGRALISLGEQDRSQPPFLEIREALAARIAICPGVIFTENTETGKTDVHCGALTAGSYREVLREVLHLPKEDGLTVNEQLPPTDLPPFRPPLDIAGETYHPNADLE